MKIRLNFIAGGLGFRYMINLIFLTTNQVLEFNYNLKLDKEYNNEEGCFKDIVDCNMAKNFRHAYRMEKAMLSFFFIYTVYFFFDLVETGGLNS
jgi:hypothetical protein